MDWTKQLISKHSPFLTGIFCLVMTHTATAQIEEVVVTAQKRAEDVQDVPISISTFSGAFMEESGIDKLQDLAAYTPNLTLTQSSQVANNRIIMRGVGSVGNSGIEPSVAVFIDGVYYPRPASVVGAMTDLEMVEVLRGPQGTLFGRNASMGALNIRTRKPTDEFEAGIRGSYGNYDAYKFSGYASGAMTDDVSGRLSFQYSDRDGYGKNTFTGTGNDSEFGAWEDISVRGKLYFTPNEDLDITLTVDYAEVNNEGPVLEVISDTVLPAYGFIISSVLSPTGPLLPTGETPELLDDGDYEVNQDHRDDAKDKQWGIAADISWSIGEHTIRSITAYRDWDNDTFESALRLPADLFNRVTAYDAQTFSQELQLISPVGQKIEYVAGLYYYDEDYKIDQDFQLGEDFCFPAVNNLVTLLSGVPAFGAAANAQCAGFRAANQAAGVNAVDTEFEQDVTSFAIFGQLTYNVTDDFRLTGGLRWTKDDKKGSFVSIINNPIVAPASLANPLGLDLRAPENAPDLDFEEDEITWLINASYHLTDDVMIFGTYSTGYKSGGFNSEGFNSIGIASGAQREFDSETVDNFEFGVKATLFDNRMVANLTYFNTQINDFQDRQFDGVNFLVQNAGELTQQGIELDVQAKPLDQLFMMLGLSYLDSDFDSFPNATNLPAVVAAIQAINRTALVPIAVPPQDLTGQRNHFSPKWQLSLVAEWADALPNTSLSWFIRGEYQYISKQNLGAETNQNPQSIQDGYDLLNGRLGLRGDSDKWEVSVFARNLTDESYCQTIFNQPIGTTLGLVDATTLGGMQRCVLGAPRTYGVEAAYRF